MTAIIVENGSIVPNANSYVSIADARLIASDYGLSLPADDDELKIALFNAVKYIENFREKLQGHRVSDTQSLNFPRNLVYINDVALSSSVIPKSLKDAQVNAASFISSGVDFFPTIDAGLVTEETIGPITTKYAYPNAGRQQFDSVDVFIKPLLIVDYGYRLSGCGF